MNENVMSQFDFYSIQSRVMFYSKHCQIQYVITGSSIHGPFFRFYDLTRRILVAKILIEINSLPKV